MALDLEPTDMGFRSSEHLPRVFGGVMDMAYPTEVATLVALMDGTTSLYTTTGSGIIGGGGHESVAREALGFLTTLEHHLGFGVDAGTDLPRPDRMAIHALTYSGRRTIEASEDELGRGLHPLAPVFHSAQRVITALRLIDTARPRSESP